MSGVALPLWVPQTLRAQARPAARLGVLNVDGRGNPDVESMFERLAQLGWVEGRNLAVEYHVVGSDLQGLSPGIKAMLRPKCDLVLAFTTPAALAVKAAAPSMPMVFAIGGDPVALGLIASMSRPGGSATGLTHLSIGSSVKMLDLLREVGSPGTELEFAL